MVYALKTKRAFGLCIKSPPGGESCHSKFPRLRKIPFPTYNQFFTWDNPKATSGEGQPSEKKHYCISLIVHYFGKLENPFNSTAAGSHPSDVLQPKSDWRELTSHWVQHWVEGGRHWLVFKLQKHCFPTGNILSKAWSAALFLGLHTDQL